MFVRCGKRYAINPVHVAFVEEVDLSGKAVSPLRVGLAIGVVLELTGEEAGPLRAFLESVSPQTPPRAATAAKSATIKKRHD